MATIDLRIGIRDQNGRITRKPSQYAGGGFHNWYANPSPTMVYLDENHFCVLPAGASSLSEDGEIELRKVVATMRAEKEVKAPTKPDTAPAKVVKPVVEDSGVIGTSDTDKKD